MVSTIYKNDIENLNTLLRGEQAAVETYEQCISKMDEPAVVAQLHSLKSSHEQRALRLAQKIRTLGGVPVEGSGAWGSFAKLVQGGAQLFGKSAAISALEEGEDHGNKRYEDLENLTPSTQQFLATEIIPEQQRSHDILSALQQHV